MMVLLDQSANTADIAVMYVFSFSEVMMTELLLFFQWYNWMVSQSKQLCFLYFPFG